MTSKKGPKRGEIWLTDLNPTIGHEIKKIRPVVVISTDSAASNGLRIIVPVTEYQQKHDRYPWCVPIKMTSLNGLTKASSADAFQIKCASVKRFQKRLGVLSSAAVNDIAYAVAICIDLPATSP